MKKVSKKDIKKWMMEIKGGDFPKWYAKLSETQKKEYQKVLNEFNYIMLTLMEKFDNWYLKDIVKKKKDEQERQRTLK